MMFFNSPHMTPKMMVLQMSKALIILSLCAPGCAYLGILKKSPDKAPGVSADQPAAGSAVMPAAGNPLMVPDVGHMSSTSVANDGGNAKKEQNAVIPVYFVPRKNLDPLSSQGLAVDGILQLCTDMQRVPWHLGQSELGDVKKQQMLAIINTPGLFSPEEQASLIKETKICFTNPLTKGSFIAVTALGLLIVGTAAVGLFTHHFGSSFFQNVSTSLADLRQTTAQVSKNVREVQKNYTKVQGDTKRITDDIMRVITEIPTTADILNTTTANVTATAGHVTTTANAVDLATKDIQSLTDPKRTEELARVIEEQLTKTLNEIINPFIANRTSDIKNAAQQIVEDTQKAAQQTVGDTLNTLKAQIPDLAKQAGEAAGTGARQGVTPSFFRSKNIKIQGDETAPPSVRETAERLTQVKPNLLKKIRNFFNGLRGTSPDSSQSSSNQSPPE